MDIVIYGFVQSVSLLLMAFGFSLVYGVSRLPNFAHGALFVLTGFVTWALVKRAVPEPRELPFPLLLTMRRITWTRSSVSRARPCRYT